MIVNLVLRKVGVLRPGSAGMEDHEDTPPRPPPFPTSDKQASPDGKIVVGTLFVPGVAICLRRASVDEITVACL